ncbi:MAG TPA: metal-sensing transcriptional repressor [Cyclobacteriaceae bacterium]|jgi:DNA-binding FrmR family transcriptional regulator|nr:metal-sensing transcriptional repressor [Cyclobacteriaceae bacterium]HRJ80916.1 metal-sensing transcriptional repressor [Cyclobacteriaceae bacterium]
MRDAVELNKNLQLMISKDLTKEFKDSIKGLSGHLLAVGKMVDKEFPDQTLLQLKAVQAGLQKVTLMLLDEVYRKALAEKISFSWQNCPGDCGYEQNIELLRNLFPEIPLESVPEKLKEAARIEAHLRKKILQK